jgi:hypothetical protein
LGSNLQNTYKIHIFKNIIYLKISDDQPTNNGEETEFSVSSVSAAAGDVSESLPLADFIRHARTD